MSPSPDFGRKPRALKRLSREVNKHEIAPYAERLVDLAQAVPFGVTDHVLLQWTQRWVDTQSCLTPETDTQTAQLHIPVSSAHAPPRG